MQTRADKRLPSAALAVILMLAGSALLLGVLYAVMASAGRLRDPAQAQLALGLYYKAVIVKGLLPQLLLTIVLHALLAPRLGEFRMARLVAWTLAASVAYAVVAPLLLTREFEHWPALEMKHVGQHVATGVMMVAACVASGRLAERIIARRGRRAAPPAPQPARPDPSEPAP